MRRASILGPPSASDNLSDNLVQAKDSTHREGQERDKRGTREGCSGQVSDNLVQAKDLLSDTNLGQRFLGVVCRCLIISLIISSRRTRC